MTEPAEEFRGKRYARINHKHLYWPRTLRAGGNFLEKDFGDIFSHEGDLKTLMAKMDGRKRQRMLRILGDVYSGQADWDSRTGKIKIFIKTDDKVFKAKPRVIQFVDSVVWLRCIMKIDNIITKIKRAGWTWEDKFSGKTFVWASGMTQKKLSETIDKLQKAVADFIAVCGDDNTDQKGDADAGKYDSTQRGLFLVFQLVLLSLMGFTDEEAELIVKLHTSPRRADGFDWSLGAAMLPSGAPWTLFVNTLGLVVYHRQVSFLETQKFEGTRTELMIFAGQMLGLDMKYNLNPQIGGEPMSGAEFLKGVFAFVGGKHYWVPLPSKLCKLGCRNVVNEKVIRSDMRQHIAEVAKGQDPFLLDPLTRIFVDSWKEFSPHQAIVPGYVNITSGDEALTLPAGQEEAWRKWWLEFYQDRYSISKMEFEEMEQQIRDHRGQLGTFTGRAWASMSARDYAGISY